MVWKFRFFGSCSKVKMEECKQNNWNIFDQFPISIDSLASCFLKVGARVSLKVATKGSIRGKKKKLWKFIFLGCFSKASREKRDKKVWNVFDEFNISIACWAICLLEVGARISLNAATKGFIAGKKSSENLDFSVAFLVQKRKSATKKFEIFFINLASLKVLELHVFWKSVHAFHWK